MQVTPNQVFFNASCDSFWLDVDEFERAVGLRDDARGSGSEIGRLEDAVQLYRGDFLAGFYDDWMLRERERLSNLYVSALERLVSLQKARSDYSSALASARRVVVEDPVRESAHREVMRLQFLLGRTTEALQQFERCQAILNEELGVQPSAKTRSLFEDIARLRDKAERPFVPAVDAPLRGDLRKIPMIGREVQRSLVVRKIDETLDGRGGIILVEGEPGIGKTRLLNELVGDAHWRGASVLWAQSDMKSHLRPYATLGEAFSSGITRLRARQLSETLEPSLLAEVAKVAPDLPGLSATADRSWDLPPADAESRIRRALLSALLGLGELAPHVLFLDDAHWIDPESLAVLQELSRTSPDPSLLVVLAYRSDEARDRIDLWRGLRDIDEAVHPDRVVLERLGTEETSLLIEEAGGTAVSRDVVEGVFHETGGNPLFVLEMLRTLFERAGEDIDPNPRPEADAEWEISSGVLRVIKRRLVNLDGPARVVLNAAATLGSRFDAELLTRMSRLEPAETLHGLEQLVQRGLVTESTEGYEFSHDQIRAVAGRLLRASTRRRLHREAAAALEAEHPDRIEDLAYHYSEAGMAEPAMRLAWQAGSRAVTLASYESAARFLQQAAKWAERAETPQGDHFELLGDLENALNVLGKRDLQAAAVDQMAAVSEGTPSMRAETYRRRAHLLAEVGSYSEAVDTASEGLQLALTEDDRQVISAAETTVGMVYSLAGNPRAALPHLERAVRLVRDLPADEADARKALGDVLLELQEYDLAVKELQAALSTYEETGNLRGVTDVKGLLGIVAMEHGQADEAEHLYEGALILARSLEYRRAEAVNLVNLANVQYSRNEITSALSNYRRAAEAFSDVGDRRGSALAHVNAASVSLSVLGETTTAAEEARTALEFFEAESHDWGAAFCLDVMASIAESKEQQLDSARQLLNQGLRLAENSHHRWLEVHLRRHVAGLELRLQRPDEARSQIQNAIRTATELELSDVIATLLAVHSEIERTAGNKGLAVQLARAATRKLGGSTEQPYGVWYTRYLAEREAGNSADSDKSLREAWRLLDLTLSDIEAEMREKSLNRVALHRDIEQARRLSWPVTVKVTLPGSDVPLGRRLTDSDLVEVVLTETEPKDYERVDPIDRRRVRIHRLVEEAASQSATLRIADLSELLGVSKATIRRDITELRRRGTEVVTRGSDASMRA